jgi:transcriptional regulator with AAA-type ATPase domain
MNEVIAATKNTLTKNQLHQIMSEIAEVGREVVNSNLALAIVIARHESEPYWEQLREELQNWMDNSIISMYVRIGKNLWLIAKENKEKLPPSYNTLYQLSFLTADELQKLDDKQQLTPSITLAEAKKFVGKSGSKKSKSSKLKQTAAMSIPVLVKYQDGTGKKRFTQEQLNKFKNVIEKNGGKVTWSDF